uniref:Large ribosomal subunit protein mL43 n=1 Tax=Clastoptera arizonana TaxID=38151 RepID=A0A1B6DVW7_9HEMI
MSNSHLFMKSGFPIPPLRNGIGRYVNQLKRITLKFCKTHGGSKGIREFIESDLVDFAKVNPGIVVYVKPRRFRAPCLTAEYLNGESQYIGCNNMSCEEVSKWLNWLRTRSGIPEMRYMKMWHTEHPTIQGVWHPFFHKNPHINVASFPQDNFFGSVKQPPSATEILLEMFQKQKSEEEQNNKESYGRETNQSC